jgi:CHASE1-domain containing sensor protein
MRPCLAAAAIGFVLSVSLWFALSIREDGLAEARFSDQAKERVSALQERIDDYLDDITALRAFFQSSEGVVSRRGFTAFSALVLPSRPAIRSLAWLPRVSSDQRGSTGLC